MTAYCVNCNRAFEGRRLVCKDCWDLQGGDYDHDETPEERLIRRREGFSAVTSERHPVRPASLVLRVVAYLIDMWIASILLLIVVGGVLIFSVAGNGEWVAQQVTAWRWIENAFSAKWQRFFQFVVVGPLGLIHGLAFIVTAIWIGLYHILFEGSRFKGPPGKRMMGLWVGSETGVPSTYRRAFVRNLARYALFLPVGLTLAVQFFTKKAVSATALWWCSRLSFLLAIGTFACCFFNQKRQGMHDLLGGSVVQSERRITPLGAVVGPLILIASAFFMADVYQQLADQKANEQWRMIAPGRLLSPSSPRVEQPSAAQGASQGN